MQGIYFFFLWANLAIRRKMSAAGSVNRAVIRMKAAAFIVLRRVLPSAPEIILPTPSINAMPSPEGINREQIRKSAVPQKIDKENLAGRPNGIGDECPQRRTDEANGTVDHLNGADLGTGKPSGLIKDDDIGGTGGDGTEKGRKRRSTIKR